ncbi:MAG: DivIVA domain-containing protein [Lachnospiraceae bacterium]|nr:DivIVA domain-containing protein [Lachnospiraceae bacterium]
MLTPVEIQNKTFRSGGLGYDRKEVDNYLKEIVRSYEEIYRKNMELNDKVDVLNDGLQYYKSIEKTLQKALMLAEKTAEDTKIAAQKEAKRIQKEATTQANIMLADAKNELESLHQKTIALIQQYEKYKTQFKNLAKANIELIESDAFSINIAKLDAFINDPEALKPIKTAEKDTEKGAASNTNGSAKNPKADSDTDSDDDGDSGHLSDYANDVEEYDFLNSELDGQEEFDFLDINDGDGDNE